MVNWGDRARKMESLHIFTSEWGFSLVLLTPTESFFFLTFPYISPFLVKPHPQGSCTPLVVATLHPQAVGVPMATQYPLPLALGCGAGRPSLLEQTATVLVKRDPPRTPPLTWSSFIFPAPIFSPLAAGIAQLSSFFLLSCYIKAKKTITTRDQIYWDAGCGACILPLYGGTIFFFLSVFPPHSFSCLFFISACLPFVFLPDSSSFLPPPFSLSAGRLQAWNACADSPVFAARSFLSWCSPFPHLLLFLSSFRGGRSPCPQLSHKKGLHSSS